MQSNGAADTRGIGSSSEREKITEGRICDLTKELNTLSREVKKGKALEEEWWAKVGPKGDPKVESNKLLQILAGSSDKAHIQVHGELVELAKKRDRLAKVQSDLAKMGAYKAQTQETGLPRRTFSNVQSERIWAVVIGINSYDHQDVNNLSGACLDAQAMFQYLLDDLAVPHSQITLLLSDTEISSDNSTQRPSSVHERATDDGIAFVPEDSVDGSVASETTSVMHSTTGPVDLEGSCVGIEAKIGNTTDAAPIAMSEEKSDCLESGGMPIKNGMTNSAATRENILRALYGIRDNSQINRDDMIVIFFAGHGAQWDFPEVEEQHIEALCPSDRGIQDATGNIVPDITDREFSILLEELYLAKGDHIVVIMDCCFSGGMTRVVPEIGTVTSRSVSCIRGLDTNSLLQTASHPLKESSKDPAAVDWTWNSETCVVLAACEPHEVAIELALPDQSGIVRGQFTACLLPTLRQRTFADYTELQQALIDGMLAREGVPLQNPMFLNIVNKAYGPWFSPQCKPEPTRSVYAKILPLAYILLTVFLCETYRRIV